MQHQFKAGDLALIVGARYRSENIGLACELIEWLDSGDCSKWTDKANGRPVFNADTFGGWLVVGDGLVTYGGNQGRGIIEARYLMPLRGGQSPTQSQTETPKELVHG